MAEPKETVYAVTEELDVARIQAIHRSGRHPGVKRTLYFVKLVNPKVPRATLQALVRDCRVSIYRSGPGTLEARQAWCI